MKYYVYSLDDLYSGRTGGVGSVGGVYAMRNKQGRIYVGMTGSSLVHRWKTHIHLLETGIHSNKRLQKAWDDDELDGLCFEVLEVVRDSSLLYRQELRWMEQSLKEGAILLNSDMPREMAERYGLPTPPKYFGRWGARHT